MKPQRVFVGDRFTRMVVLARAGSRAVCRCDCGVVKSIHAHDLTRGATRSCGCWNSDRVIRRNTKHGEAVGHRPSAEWVCWKSMHQRCRDRNHRRYADWGGRGITVCARWSGPRGFERFLADMGRRPPGLTLERKKNDLGYSPTNCEWATRKAQANNRRTAKPRRRTS